MNPAARWLAILLLAVAPPVLAQGGGKILRITFQAGETGFDPVRTHDYYSGHILEAVFKAIARALRQAVEIDPRASGIPSTKGVL